MIRRLIHHAYFAPVTLGVGMALRLVWILCVDWTPVSDGAWYFERAVSMASGEGYVLEGRPTALFPVGYSAMLAGVFLLTGPSLLSGQLLNLLASCFLLYFAYRLAGHWFKSETTGRLTLLILALYPNHIAYHTLLLSELVFTALLLAGIAYLQAGEKALSWRFFAGVLIFAGAVYVKPWVVFLPVVLFLGSERSTFFRKTTVAYGLFLLLLLPWMYRNHQVLDAWSFSTNGGLNLYIGNNPLATGTYGFEGGPVDLLPVHEGEVARDLMARKAALDYLKSHPGEALARIPQKWYYLFWMGNEGIYWHKMGGNDLGLTLSRLTELAYRILITGFVLIFLLGLIPSLRRRCAYPLLPAGVLLYFLLVYAVFFGYSRYHFPMIPFMSMYLAEGLRAWVFKGEVSMGREKQKI